MRTYVNYTVVSFLLCALATIGACATPKVELPAEYVDNGVQVSVEGLYRNGLSSYAGVSGTAINTTDTAFDTCMLKFDVVDAEGAKVADALATTMGLEPGQKWKFQAVFTAPFGAMFHKIAPGKVTVIRRQWAPKQPVP